MKNLKKILASLTAVFMMLVCFGSASVFAEGETETITFPSDGHSYTVYQIFTGDVNVTTTTSKVLSNIKWGTDSTGTPGNTVDDETLAAIMATVGKTDSEILAVVETYKLGSATGTTIAANAETRTINVKPGYYLIVDNGDGTGDFSGTYSLNVLQVVSSLTVTPKRDIPTDEKYVKETNDSTGYVSDWQKKADYDINDDVPFLLKATIAQDFANYSYGYKLTFHDTLDVGLTFNDSSVVVKINGTTLSKDATVTIGEETVSAYTVTTSTTDNCTFEVSFADLKQVSGVQAETIITVEYTAKLNGNAVIGNPGNKNKSHITFTNNPNDEQFGENGSTEDKTVVVFTFESIFNKIDGDSKEALFNAGFTLNKWTDDTEEGGEETSGHWELVETIAASATNSTFQFKGLDAGKYQLVESTTPSGYNTMSPLEFEVVANYDENGNFTGVSATGFAATTTTLDGATEPTAVSGSLSRNIENNKGSELPSTGGMGTTILYVAGGILIIGAAIFFVTNKRMQRN